MNYVDDISIAPCDSLTNEIKNTGTATFSLSPNPVQNLLTINFPSPSALASDETLAVYDALGRKVKSYTLAASQKTFELSVAELPVGFYLVAVNSGGQVWSEMVVKE